MPVEIIDDFGNVTMKLTAPSGVFPTHQGSALAASVQVIGSSITLEGSNDGLNWSTVKNVFNEDVVMATGITEITFAGNFLRVATIPSGTIVLVTLKGET